MAKSKKVKPEGLLKEINRELTLYHETVLGRINQAAKEAVGELVKKTKVTAPKQTGEYRKHISSKLLKKSRLGDETYVWYVKPPDHRLTHLLVHGHAKVNGGRTKADPFLRNAVDDVRADFEKAVEEAVKSD